MEKKDFIEELKKENQYLEEEMDEEEEDLMGSVWVPVLMETKMEKLAKEKILSDPSIKEIDLAEITEKEVFVRKANLVSYLNFLYKSFMLVVG